MGQEKCTGEIKNTHTISVGNCERKRYFGKYRARRDVTGNVTNWTQRDSITFAFH